MGKPTDGKLEKNPVTVEGRGQAVSSLQKLARWLAVLSPFVKPWRALSLERKFLLTATLAIVLSMVTLGYWVEKRIRVGWIQGMAETGALYLEGFLAHHVQTLENSRILPAESQTEIQNLLSNTRLGNRVAIIKIWDLDGNLIYSTNNSDSHEKLHSGYIDRIKDGQVVVDDDTDDHISELKSLKITPRLIEIYAPIYKMNSNNIIAIGEFYEYDKFLRSEINSVKYGTWFLIFNVSIIIIVLLRIIVSKTGKTIGDQQELLESNFARAAELAKRNNVLRRAADRARLNATILNETYLASIGADIHDGPIQVLSLMMLKLPNAKANATQPDELGIVRKDLEPLIQQTLADLRNLSAGLVLPEVENLSPMETIDLAITRHEHQTGTMVLRDLEDLPERVSRAIRVCAYRVVQEALNNSFKHAGGQGQRVSARLNGKMLEIVVTDIGMAPTLQRHHPARSAKLGLQGMDSRVRALRGSLTIARLVNGGTEVRATLPVRS
ncbi:ATP-binding protein [Bosea vestrisii]|uniref:sensor histidine kinase n=1 Tax=Bosea vestrisii TaxID=151416 RepID=UPI0024E03DD5|nr:ATP-binding protein [Bosea vestrisii]WID99330.1 ATP-binding protein [Bosea vestrisii]